MNAHTNCLARAALALLALLALSAGCASSKPAEPDPSWARAQIQAGSERVIWEVTVLTLAKLGFPVGGGLEPGILEATSGWKTHMAPFKGQGYREQAVVRYEPLGEGRYDVEVRVRRQKNQALVKPMDLSYAEWEWTADNLETARVLLQHIKVYFEPEFNTERP